MAVQAGGSPGNAIERTRKRRRPSRSRTSSSACSGFGSERSAGQRLTAREILSEGPRGSGTVSAISRRSGQARATIGLVHTGLGLYGEAQRLLDRALQTQRRVAGEDNLETVATANALANVYWFQAKYPEAEALYQDVVQRRTRLLGEDHPDTLRANGDLASLYLRQKRLDEFERLGQTVLVKQRRILGNAHPDTFASVNNLQ